MKRTNIIIAATITIVGCTGQEQLTKVTTSQTSKSDEGQESRTYTDDVFEVWNVTSNPFIDQDYFINIDHQYKLTVTPQELQQTTRLEEIIPDYPNSWISEYKNVLITTYSSEGEKNALGVNQQLTPAQTDLLRSAIPGMTFSTEINYNYPNTVSGNAELQQSFYWFEVVPETEAQYPKGKVALMNHIRFRSRDFLNRKMSFLSEPGSIMFIVNELGEIHDVIVENSSGDKEIDTHFKTLLKELSSWIPAQDHDGNAISQSFRFSFGKPGC